MNSARYGTLALTEPGHPIGSSVERVSASALKHFATAWGIASDKLTILQGRPTQIIRHEESEAQRPAIWALVQRLTELEQIPAASNIGDRETTAETPGLDASV